MGNNEELAVINENNQPMTLLHETNPSLILEEATEIANALADIIKKKRLYKKIGNKDHVYVEGWTTLGALVKVFPILEYSKKLDREDEIIYESKVIAKTLKDEIIGIGEAICSNKEKNWMYSDEYAIKSMSITRATSKALRIPLGWIMVLAGYEGTPFEEMPQQTGTNKTRTMRSVKKPAGRRKPAQADPMEDEVNNIVDAEFEKKPRKDEPETVNMAKADVKKLLGINEEYDKWIHTVEDLEVTADEAYKQAQELLGEQKLIPTEMKKVKEALGMDVK